VKPIKLICAIAAAALLAGCSTPGRNDLPPPPETPLPEEARTGDCDRGLAALIGGAIGAAIYDENRARGAVVGAGLGALACSIINAASRQTRSTAEVEREYRAAHQGRLPEQPTLSVYDTAYNAAGGVRVGQEARVVSTMTLVAGTREPVQELSEVLEVFDPARPGAPVIRVDKRMDEAKSGSIQNTFSIRLPPGMAAGDYPARTTLYINRKPVAENRGTLRVLG
jgi:hypothetical protein